MKTRIISIYRIKTFKSCISGSPYIHLLESSIEHAFLFARVLNLWYLGWLKFKLKQGWRVVLHMIYTYDCTSTNILRNLKCELLA